MQMTKQLLHRNNSSNLVSLFVLFVLLVVPVRASRAAGTWKLENLWREDASLLPIRGDGKTYFFRIEPREEHTTTEAPETLGLSVKVGNVMRTTVEVVGDQPSAPDDGEYRSTIKVDPLMSTRMMPGSQEQQQLEDYLSKQLPRMVTLEVRGGSGSDPDNARLVLASAGQARIECTQASDAEA